MKKILLILFFIKLNLLGTGFQIQGFQNDKKEEKKYSEIINYLKSQKDGESYFYLASFYINGSSEPDSEGKSIEKNTDLAIEYLKKAVNLNFPHAAVTLGSLYIYHKDFVLKENNLEEAEKYLKIAIDNELYEAYTTLADIYFSFKEDGKKAVEYLFLGANHNVSASQYALAVIYDKGLKSKDFVLEANEEIASKFLTDACLNNRKTKTLEEICSSELVIKETLGE